MRKFATALTTAFALSLSACGGGEEGSLKGEPVAEVKAPEGQQWVDTVSVTEEGGYLIGNPDAPIKLTEYASYTCPGCGKFSTDASEELDSSYINSGKVSLEYRNFIRDPLDLAAAVAIRCGTKESFYPLSKQFFESQIEILTQAQQLDQGVNQRISAADPLDRPGIYAEALGLYEYFGQRGIARDQLQACLSDKENLQKLADMVEGYSKKYDIQGTPTFFVNGNKLNTVGWNDVKKLLQDAGAR